MRRLSDTWLSAGGSSRGLVQCWSSGALDAAAWVSGTIVAAMSGDPPEERRQRRTLGRARVTIALEPRESQEPARARWLDAGSRDVRVSSGPGFPASTAEFQHVRSSLASPEQVLVGLIAERPTQADAAKFAFMLGLLFTTGIPMTGVVPAGSGGMRAAARFLRAHGRRWAVLPTDASYATALRGCDVVVWPGNQGGLVQAAACVAAGIPVVMPACDGAERLLGSSARRCIAASAEMKPLGQRLLELCGDEGLRRDLRTLLRERLRTGSPQSFGEVFKGVWEEAVRERGR
ncbi:MAG: hypothetical protein H7Y88_02955 [Phycisphaerales bacterium]|nr:hypothetical protein [Phycisphaerales bacterium]